MLRLLRRLACRRSEARNRCVTRNIRPSCFRLLFILGNNAIQNIIYTIIFEIRHLRTYFSEVQKASQAALAEQEWLLPWIDEWLAFSEDERLSFSKHTVKGFISLPPATQARHLALCIDLHLAHSLLLRDSAAAQEHQERLHRG